MQIEDFRAFACQINHVGDVQNSKVYKIEIEVAGNKFFPQPLERKKMLRGKNAN